MEHTAQDDSIICPFLAIAEPDTSRWRRFIAGCRRNGMSAPMALGAVVSVVRAQQGLTAALRGRVPDLLRLDEVPGISHDDLYSKYVDELREQAASVQVDGEITLQDLADMKRWVARREGVEINDASRQETSLLFLFAGGDTSTQRVRTDDAFAVMCSIAPTARGRVTVSAFQRTQKLIDWHGA